jgi:hypothetical protein
MVTASTPACSPPARSRPLRANRKAAIADAIDRAADLLRASVDHSSDGKGRDRTGWPQDPRALAGRLRRAQTSLRALGIEIAFTREGRAGSRIIRMHASPEDTVCTVSDNAKLSGSSTENSR